MIDNNRELADEDLLPVNCCIFEKKLTLPINPTLQDVNNIDMDPFEVAKDNFNSLITALRLLNEGQVEWENIYTRHDYPGQIIVVNACGRLSSQIHKLADSSASYVLHHEQIPTFEKIYFAIKNGLIPIRMRTAVDRINFAMDRDRADDKLLDLLIAIESIYGGASGAIGYKIGMRSAVFVETDYEKRDLVRKLMNEAYSLRSALVHGSKKNESFTKNSTEQIVKELLVLVRKSINKIIGIAILKEKIPNGEDFDKMLINPSLSVDI